MIIYIFIISHLLADFVFQSAKLAEKKTRKFGYLIIHSIIYTIVFSISIFAFIELKSGILPYAIIAVSHFLIDWIRIIINNKFHKNIIAFYSFLVDQFLHIFILTLLFIIFSLDARTNNFFEYCQKWEHFNALIVYILIFIIIWNPTAVFIGKLFKYIIDDNNSPVEEYDPQIGRIIGKLERIIICCLVLCNQIGAIGFVLAAKSIARYKQLEDKNFAEKYLVGTLASASIAFITALLLKKLI